MRVRLQSQPPLPLLKAWFEIPLALVNPQETIEDLKVELCRKVLTPPWTGKHGPSDTLKGNEKLRADQIILEIDDFELLDGSAVNVIRENDLILYTLILVLPMLEFLTALTESSIKHFQCSAKREKGGHH
jgi:hypothetical protein